MARIHPHGWQSLAVTGAALREIETLRVFEATLPAQYTVHHGVHWTRIEHGCSVYGEIDFIVVAPNGRVLLIEQKSGFLDETETGLVKSYGTQKKRIAPQIMRAIDGLMTRFSHARRGGMAQASKLSLDYLLYCPDYRVRNPERAGIAPERIVDSTRRDELSRIVMAIVEAAPDAACASEAEVSRFLSSELALVADVSALIGRAGAWVTRLSGGLAQWAMRLDFTPFRLRIEGTAGSGKTQLALAVLNDAVATQRRALYLCYNRPLADHVARVAPEGIAALTFHGFGDRVMRTHGTVPDFGAPDIYRQLEAAVFDATPDEADLFDVLIVDEGQDFSPAWRDAAMKFLRPSGRAYWLEDPMQNLYGREPVPLPGWVTLTANVNYRSPRDIIEGLAPLLIQGFAKNGTGFDVQAASPLAGSDLDITTWDESDAAARTRAVIDATMRAITKALALGYRKSDIVVLSYTGREHSALLAFDTIGPHALRRFTGAYDLFGNPVYSAGDVLLETIYRFKGQSAPCVIFSEIDFESLDERACRKLFVGATRATTKLMLVMSERAARICLVDEARAK